MGWAKLGIIMHTAINYFANTHHEESKIDINPRMTMWLVLFLKSTIDIILLFEVIHRKHFSKPSNNTHITYIKIRHEPNVNYDHDHLILGIFVVANAMK